eukprot:CAMPEP_0184014654 /NCGR_PEP_ID=MMETSP0954-20121128/5815_1 /TAXON_ID=627963 /ORGANISM="Aplanochytrium sp, Strain PBS07" /LENGTH=44 /DNA_ID= /DNA_START= /DNA_END= /DNA_ORIENTATION=
MAEMNSQFQDECLNLRKSLIRKVRHNLARNLSASVLKRKEHANE